MTCEVCDGYTDANGNDRATPDPRSQATDGMRVGRTRHGRRHRQPVGLIR